MKTPTINHSPFGLATLCALVLGSPLQAATVNWNTPQPITDSTEVATTGTAVLAVEAERNAPAPRTVNGVTFTPASHTAGAALPYTQGGVTFTATINSSGLGASMNATDPYLGSKALAGADGAAYGQMIGNSFEVNGGGAVTLAGLTDGNQYLVQFWVADFRQYPNNRSITIGSAGATGNTSAQLLFLGGNGSSTSSGRGNFITGIFTADGATQEFPINVAGADNVAMVNAFQLRDLGLPSVTLSPSFNPVTGTYIVNGATKDITLTSETGATIYYTMDGNDPTTGSTSGASPLVVAIAVPTTVTVKAMAAIAGKANSAIIAGEYTTVQGTGTWINPAGGSWGTAGNWLNAFIPDEANLTADFSTLSLGTDVTVTLDGERWIKNLVFDDQNPTKHAWTISGDPATPAALELKGDGSTPVIDARVDVILDDVDLIANAGFTKAGSGILTLTGMNSYTGATSVAAGTLTSNGSNSIGSLAVNGGTMQLAGGTLASTPFTTSSGGTIRVIGGVWDVNCTSNPIISTLDHAGDPVCNYIQTGGTVDLTGHANTLYTSNFASKSELAISRGTFNAGGIRIGMRGDAVATISDAGVVTVTSFDFGHTINIGAPARILNLGDGATFSGGTGIDDGGTSGILATGKVQFLSGAGTATLNLNGGTLRATADATDFVSSALTSAMVMEGGVIVDSQAFNITIAEPILHGGVAETDGGLVKTGGGTLKLSGFNSYTGPTKVRVGTLLVNGSLENSPSVTVAAGAALGGTGTVVGPITAAGTIAPGTSVGTLYTSGVTLSGTLACEIDGADIDLLDVQGNLDITGATLAVSELNPATETSYAIAIFTGTLKGTFASITPGYEASYATPNQVVITKVATPYSTWADSWAGLTDKTPQGDPDNDGIQNLVEYVIGGDPRVSSTEFLPKQNIVGTDLVLTYQRNDASEADTTQTGQWSANLDAWTNIAPVLINENGTDPDDMKLVIPTTHAVNGKLFGRFKVTQP